MKRTTSAVHQAAQNHDPGAELDRAKKKIQRSTIIKHGYACCELWTAAIDIFSVARKLYIIAPSRVTISTHVVGEMPFNSWAAQTSTPALQGFGVHMPKQPDDLTDGPYHSPMRAMQANAGSARRPSLDATMNEGDVLWVGNAAFDLSRLAATPPLSANKLAKVRRKQRQNENLVPADEPDLTPDLAPGVNIDLTQQQQQQQQVRPEAMSGQRYLDWQDEKLRHLQRVQGGASDGYRDTSLRGHLPLTVCQQILPYVVDSRTLGLLSNRQQKQVLEWGQLHDSLSTEIDWRNRDKASQVWMLLEALECLEQE